MATKEQYELGARRLAKSIRETSDMQEKSRLMTYLGNARYNQFLCYKDRRARNLATNCYLAAKLLSNRATAA